MPPRLLVRGGVVDLALAGRRGGGELDLGCLERLRDGTKSNRQSRGRSHARYVCGSCRFHVSLSLVAFFLVRGRAVLAVYVCYCCVCLNCVG